MILVAYGGSGSTYLRLKKAPLVYGENNVHSCIDVDFKPEFWREGNHVPLLNGYSEKPNSLLRVYFFRRTSFNMAASLSIEDNLAQYFKSRMADNFFTHLTFASYYNFFSRNQIRNVVFLVRHPVDQAVSYLHSDLGTHGREAKENGFDIATQKGAEIFGQIWKANLIEYQTLHKIGLNPFLVRFDNWQSDIKLLTQKQQILFIGFNGNSKHRKNLPKDANKVLNLIAKDSGLWQ